MGYSIQKVIFGKKEMMKKKKKVIKTPTETKWNVLRRNVEGKTWPRNAARHDGAIVHNEKKAECTCTLFRTSYSNPKLNSFETKLYTMLDLFEMKFT